MSEVYYLEKMAEAEEAASATKLSNVRERWLRSAAAWKVMAARVADTEEMKRGNAKSTDRS